MVPSIEKILQITLMPLVLETSPSKLRQPSMGKLEKSFTSSLK
jgi:hypothetical protein